MSIPTTLSPRPRRLAAAALLALLWLAAPAGAAELKVGYVNAARLLQEAPQAEAVSRRLKQEFALRQDRLVAKQKELRQLEDRLARDGAIMSDQERRKLERQLVEGKRELSRAQEDLREDFNLRRNEEISKLLQMVQRTIEGLGRERGYDLILYDGVAFASPRVDLTEEVLKRLRQQARRAGEGAAG
ncbi:MAG: OmpH family outer membrane protein, partial [Gammaproteobacteria bacterium]